MQAISIIKSEHKSLGAVLYSLDKLINRLPAPLGLGDDWK